MNNTIKLFRIIAITVIIGMGLVGCENDDTQILKVINQCEKPITCIWAGPDTFENLNITTGQSQTFVLDGFVTLQASQFFSVRIRTGLETGDWEFKEVSSIWFEMGETKTVTLTVNGDIQG